jgi:hypothetical protein
MIGVIVKIALPVLVYAVYGLLVDFNLLGKTFAISDTNGLPFLTQTTTYGGLGDADFRRSTASLGTVSDGCEVLTGFTDTKEMFSAAGFEDVIHVGNDTAVACAGSLGTMWVPSKVWSAASDPAVTGTQCAIISASGGGALRIAPLPVLGLPAGADGKPLLMHSHGLFYRGGKLYMVNHAYRSGGERVDAFTLDVAAGTLTWYGGLRAPLFDRYNGVLNDLVVVSDSALYVTAYMDIADSMAGRRHGDTVYHLLVKPYMILHKLLRINQTPVLYCTFALQQGATTQASCVSDAVKPFAMANGIALSAAGGEEFVTVVDMTASQLHLHHRCGAGGGALCVAGVLPLFHTCDNIQPDPHRPPTVAGDTTTLHFTVGSIASLWAASEQSEGKGGGSIGGVTRVQVALVREAGAHGPVFRLAGGLQTDVAFHDGRALPGLASGIELKAADGSVTVVAGSYCATGLMACKL